MATEETETYQSPELAVVTYRKLTGPFKPGERHTFELMLVTATSTVPGETPLMNRLRLQFGRRFVRMVWAQEGTRVIRIESPPLFKEWTREYIAKTIVYVTEQHYGWTIPVQTMEVAATVSSRAEPTQRTA